ncbi:MAG: hypothetical protein ACI8V8_002258, partial [Chitinophagales bacterium]
MVNVMDKLVLNLFYSTVKGKMDIVRT